MRTAFIGRQRGHDITSIKLICGRSRAGKTTYSKHIHNVIHLDNYGIGDRPYPKVIDKVRQMDEDVTVEGIYDTAERRMALLDAFRGDGKKTCIWLDTDLDEIERRFGRWKPSSLPHKFEPPTYDEGWDEIIVVKDGKEGLLETSNTHSPLERGTVGDVPPAE